MLRDRKVIFVQHLHIEYVQKLSGVRDLVNLHVQNDGRPVSTNLSVSWLSIYNSNHFRRDGIIPPALCITDMAQENSAFVWDVDPKSDVRRSALVLVCLPSVSLDLLFVHFLCLLLPPLPFLVGSCLKLQTCLLEH